MSHRGDGVVRFCAAPIPGGPQFRPARSLNRCGKQQDLIGIVAKSIGISDWELCAVFVSLFLGTVVLGLFHVAALTPYYNLTAPPPAPSPQTVATLFGSSMTVDAAIFLSLVVVAAAAGRETRRRSNWVKTVYYLLFFIVTAYLFYAMILSASTIEISDWVSVDYVNAVMNANYQSWALGAAILLFGLILVFSPDNPNELTQQERARPGSKD